MSEPLVTPYIREFLARLREELRLKVEHDMKALEELDAYIASFPPLPEPPKDPS